MVRAHASFRGTCQQMNTSKKMITKQERSKAMCIVDKESFIELCVLAAFGILQRSRLDSQTAQEYSRPCADFGTQQRE
jgi:hypothetical protein